MIVRITGHLVSLVPLELEYMTLTARAQYYEWMNSPEIVQYLEARFALQTHERLSDYVKAANADPNVYLFGILANERDQPLSYVGNLRLGRVNTVHRFAEVGLVIAPRSNWGKGYGTDAIRAVTHFAFHELGLHKLVAGSYAENVGSIRAFEKAGWEREGALRSQYFFEGHYTSDVLLCCVNPAEDAPKPTAHLNLSTGITGNRIILGGGEPEP